MVKVRQRHAYAKSVLRSDPSVPSADMIGSEQVGTAKCIGQPLQPAVEVNGGAAGGGRPGKDDGFGAVVILYVIESQRGEIERLVPGDASPTGIRIALGSGSYHWIM